MKKSLIILVAFFGLWGCAAFRRGVPLPLPRPDVIPVATATESARGELAATRRAVAEVSERVAEATDAANSIAATAKEIAEKGTAAHSAVSAELEANTARLRESLRVGDTKLREVEAKAQSAEARLLEVSESLLKYVKKVEEQGDELISTRNKLVTEMARSEKLSAEKKLAENEASEAKSALFWTRFRQWAAVAGTTIFGVLWGIGKFAIKSAI